MKAEIIAVGSELLTPDRLDTNSLYLTEQLNSIGIEVVRKTIVGDNESLLREVFREAMGRVELIISSGGLGPTQDDLTRETVADLLGRRLQRDEKIVAVHSRAIPQSRARDAGGEHPPGDGAGRRGGAGKSARHRARTVDRGFRTFHRAASRAAARVEAAVSRAGVAAPGTPRVGRAPASAAAARHWARRIARRAAHPADLWSLC